MFHGVKIGWALIGLVSTPRLRCRIVLEKLKFLLAGLCLMTAGLLPLPAAGQITEPLLPLLPGGQALTAPTAPPTAPVEPESGYAGETVTSRLRSEFNGFGVRFGEFYWFPRAELDESYNSNIFATTTHPSADLTSTLGPSFDLVSIFPRSALDLNASAALQQYAVHSAQNTQSGSVGANGTLDVSAQSSITGSAQVSHPYIAYGSPNSPTDIAEPVTYWDYTARAGYQHGGSRFTYGIDAGVAAAQYNAAPLLGGGVSPQSSQNSIIPDAAVNVGYEIAPDYLGFVRIDGSRYEFLRAPFASSTTYRADFGLLIEPRHLIYGNVYAGYLFQNYHSTTGSNNIPDYGGRLVWTVTTLTTLTFDGGRAFYTGTPATASSLTPGPAGNSYLTSSVGARADHELLRNLLLTIDATYEDETFQGITRTDHIFTAGTGFTYFVNRHLFLGGYFNYYKQTSTAAGVSFTQNILLLRLGTQF
jgi:hypothetical protein